MNDDAWERMDKAEIVAFLESHLGQPDGFLAGLVTTENDRRQATRDAELAEPITVHGVTLTPGHWYDIVSRYSKVAYRGMRYLDPQWGGRYSNYDKGARFEKWGAKPTVAWAKPTVISPDSITSITEITPTDRQVALASEQDARTARYEERKAAR